VQRHKVYADNADDDAKDSFREGLSSFVETVVLGKYTKMVAEEDHLENILSLKNYSEYSYPTVLYNNEYKIGTAQKLLNLTLKYYWCLDWISVPPHCPIDSIVLKRADIKGENWTEIVSIEKYQKIINQIREYAGKTDIATWELENYHRR
jgi:hypothetical protein